MFSSVGMLVKDRTMLIWVLLLLVGVAVYAACRIRMVAADAEAPIQRDRDAGAGKFEGSACLGASQFPAGRLMVRRAGNTDRIWRISQ
jgi:hypothetical protein